jgi:hypothetical protein
MGKLIGKTIGLTLRHPVANGDVNAPLLTL